MPSAFLTGLLAIVLALQPAFTVAQGSSSTGFSATSSGASFGIDLGSGLPVASGSYATGEGDGTGVTNLNSHVTGTGTVVLNSGADTVLKGAVVSGETVIANVGGDLLIESLQDTASYDEKSFSVSAGFGPSGLSGGVNKGTVTGDFANVAEQSGIVAGSGGYHVAVEGGVDLIGGVIASTDTTGNSSLSADHLTFSDLENRSSASTSNIGLSASLPLQGSDAASAPLGGLAITPTVGQPAMESDGGVAHATLTPGTLSLSNQTQDLASLNTDLSKANAQVEIYDIEELKAKQRSAAALSELLNIGVGDLSKALGFEEGSPEKVALHAAVGALTAELAGGNALTGALAGGASEIANGVLADVLAANPNLNEAQKAAITQWVAAAVGAAIGGELGAATGLDNVNYNFLKHEQEEAARKKRAALQEAYADCKANLGNGCSGEELASIEQQLIALKAEAQEQSTQNIVDLVNACGTSMTSKACMDGRAELQAALDNAGLQQGLLGSGATNTPDVLLAQVLMQADQGAIAPGGLSAAYSQALVRDQKITTGIALTAVAVAGGVIAAETYSWCMVNPNACVAIVEMASCAAAGPCDNLSAAVGNISPKAASNAADDLAALAKTHAGQGSGVATNTGERIVVRA